EDQLPTRAKDACCFGNGPCMIGPRHAAVVRDDQVEAASLEWETLCTSRDQSCVDAFAIKKGASVLELPLGDVDAGDARTLLGEPCGPLPTTAPELEDVEFADRWEQKEFGFWDPPAAPGIGRRTDRGRPGTRRSADSRARDWPARVPSFRPPLE